MKYEICKTKNEIQPAPKDAGTRKNRTLSTPASRFLLLIHHVPAPGLAGFLTKFSFNFNDFFSAGGPGSGETTTGGVEIGGGSRLNCFMVNRSGAMEPLALRSASGRSESVLDFSGGLYFGMGLVRTLSV